MNARRRARSKSAKATYPAAVAKKRAALTFDDVREIGLALPNTSEATAWGSPCLTVNGNRFCGMAINKSAEPNSLGLHCAFETRDAMIAEQPDVYYTAPHYENYPVVLVRLSRVDRNVLGDLLRMAHGYESRRPRKRKAAPLVAKPRSSARTRSAARRKRG
jgi:hypothetical protein